MIVFRTKHHADIMMLDQVALNMIRLMEHSEVVPGALTDDEVEQAFNRLSQAIKTASAQSGDSWDDDSVSMSHRGQPLLDLLASAMRHGDYVTWEKSLL
ncbi:MAG: DUF1840 domain-containing protein [Thiotrichales bacterium]|nr:DUF1840 domain-containing protein [Thiotrichales bacterium]